MRSPICFAIIPLLLVGAKLGLSQMQKDNERSCLQGQGDLLSRFIHPITHMSASSLDVV